MSGSCTHSPYSQINRLATFKGFHLDSWYRSIVLSSPSSKKNLNVAHVLRLQRPHNAMCGWPMCIHTNLFPLLFTILNWFNECCVCSALPPIHVFMVAHRIVTQQFYFQCLRISSVTLICHVYTPIEKFWLRGWIRTNGPCLFTLLRCHLPS